jgi:uncharacterized protein (TIGR02284 family)
MTNGGFLKINQNIRTMENTERTIEILNDLVLINNDRISGYERALKEAEKSANDADLIPLFLRFIDESRRYKVELGTEIGVFGRDMATGNSAPGKLHRSWMVVKEAFTGHDRYSILEECELGEDAIRKAYSHALSDEVLPAYIREMLADQQGELVEAHEEIKSLRHSVG